MDYTPISVGRVLTAFGLTIVVGVLPIFAVGLSRGPFSESDRYGGLMLVLGSIVVAMTLIGLSWLAVSFGRRVGRRPSRA